MGKRTKALDRKRKGLAFLSGEKKKLIVFSLKDYDRTQGQSYKKWEEEKIMSKLMERLQAISSLTIIEAINKGILNDYKDFPPKDKTDFKFPRYIYPSAHWAALVIGGKERVAGYLEDNTFYIVFLDKDHRFWISPKKHT